MDGWMDGTRWLINESPITISAPWRADSITPASLHRFESVRYFSRATLSHIALWYLHLPWMNVYNLVYTRCGMCATSAFPCAVRLTRSLFRGQKCDPYIWHVSAAWCLECALLQTSSHPRGEYNQALPESDNNWTETKRRYKTAHGRRPALGCTWFLVQLRVAHCSCRYLIK